MRRAQLIDLGLRPGAIDHRLRTGRLHRVHVGVYSLAPPTLLSRYGRWTAAVLACGDGAVLSHASAAALWELRATSAALIDVTIPTYAGIQRPGIRVHRSMTLFDAETTTNQGIPTTTPGRTLLDLAATMPARALERAIDQAEALGLDITLRHEHAGHRGAARLAAVRASHGPGTTLTRSELEEPFLTLCDDHGIPRPEVNRRVAGYEVDFLWRAHRVVAELDGARWHQSRAAFERDRERDTFLTARGFRVLRFTHRRVVGDAAAVAEVLRAVLRQNPGHG